MFINLICTMKRCKQKCWCIDKNNIEKFLLSGANLIYILFTILGTLGGGWKSSCTKDHGWNAVNSVLFWHVFSNSHEKLNRLKFDKWYNMWTLIVSRKNLIRDGKQWSIYVNLFCQSLHSQMLLYVS